MCAGMQPSGILRGNLKVTRKTMDAAPGVFLYAATFFNNPVERLPQPSEVRRRTKTARRRLSQFRCDNRAAGEQASKRLPRKSREAEKGSEREKRLSSRSPLPPTPFSSSLPSAHARRMNVGDSGRRTPPPFPRC
ncbi:Hypothetical predicted protein [Podarcis lilfordi]|uniref:Uncharacterized protein n=1 Tax=Podarcis lilfordi TaxID=74358 RepID=A0AA35JWA8_9SAUR|nr:Hypothetical predicted protein [Podarcis lilfordi]